MITVATVYYESLDVPDFSRCYSPEWVDKLYRGVARNLTQPFRFVALTDRQYGFAEPIEQQKLLDTRWTTACIQLYGIEADRLLLLGLDTIITGNLDAIIAYEGPLAVPRDPYRTIHPCNGVVLCPPRPDIVAAALSSPNVSDMTVLDPFAHEWLDDLFPGQIKSYKVHVQGQGVGDARIVYFHGSPKPHQLGHLPWVKKGWV